MTRVRQWRSAAATAGLVIALGTAGSVAHAAPAPGVSSRDTAFLRSIHQANLAEIVSSQHAKVHGRTACVRQVATILVRDHRRLDASAVALAARLKVKLPTATTTAQQAQFAAVKAKTGTAAYNSAWLNLQARAHNEALRLIDSELASGRNAQVKAAARAARPVIVHHLAMVRGGACHAPRPAQTHGHGHRAQVPAARPAARH
jgi:putative membrane protein